MSVIESEVVTQYPVHWLVWHNKHEELKQALQNNEVSGEEMERKDPRGRTPLLLAITLGHTECVRALLDADADVNCEKDGWTAVQEATARGDAALLALVLARRDHRRHEARAAGVPALLDRLSLAPDFYVEMKWEFTSWVPLVSRLCPSDTYRVYKRGANVRVDTTLLGFSDNRWQRGDRSYIFTGHGKSAKLVELDHGAGTVWTEWLEGPAEGGAGGAGAGRAWPEPPAAHVAQRLRTPLHLNYLDTDKICFERNKSGIWGWRQDKCEAVNGFECKVFSANNVELVSKTRWEHVPRGERRAPRAPLAGLLAAADEEPEPAGPPDAGPPDAAPVPWQEYFDGALPERAVGRPRELTAKVQKFRATLWLCEDYPLELQEQIMPILDLMASISSPHFAKLKDFIQMQLPSGFPVKIEIPLFHVVSARITFGNLFGGDAVVRHVARLAAGGARGPACVLDDAAFALGRGYRAAGSPDERVDDDELLHFAIQQSLMEAGTQRDRVDVWEALRGARPARAEPEPEPAPDDLLAHEQTMLQSLFQIILRRK
ncbi:ankyrin repeat domain-containing protein 13D isoform X2 [Colias croceus]|uniref:ankyrin repeat domain-containing protein 13D isoform X2 n=1 Tax=Colias crocea TaxID=72248 RepID=UPI001E27A61C|nr:ankyrin repeat domain-containing protein 13D isoform X2 [Colias croceus]